MRGDFETWQALHHDCAPEGCGTCVPVDISDWPPYQMRQVQQAAALTGVSVEVFVHKAVAWAMEKEFGR